jgi:CBS domain-containing protein
MGFTGSAQEKIYSGGCVIEIQHCMKKNVFSIPKTATVREAVQLLVNRRIGLLPVVDAQMHPVGVVGLRDLLNLALPSVIHMLEDVDFFGDFGAVEAFQPSEDVLSQPITSIMRSGTVVQADSGSLRAYALMLQHDLHDLPIVNKEGELVGIVSRVDIGVSTLSSWLEA